MHACELPINIEQHLACLSASKGAHKKKLLNITTPITLCLTRVITLHIHHSTESTSMPALLHPVSHNVSKSQMTQLLRYYIRMTHTRKSDL